jgi:hypothetical protein
LRDANANLLADGFIPGATDTVSAAGTSSLTVDSTEIQTVSGSSSHTFTLPTTSVPRGMRFTIVNGSSGGGVNVNSSNGNNLSTLNAGLSATYVARQATPTTSAHWQKQVFPNGDIASGVSGSSVAQRDGNGCLLAASFIPLGATVTSAAGTTTLQSGNSQALVITGTTTQTVTLNGTGMTVGQNFRIINKSTGTVTVNSSNGNLVKSLTTGLGTTVTVAVAGPTTSAHWDAT